jgi:thiol:disulfide interchange protein
MRGFGSGRGHFALAALAVAALLLAGLATPPAGAAIPRPEKAKLALQADRPVYAAGATARLSALVAIEPGWHVNSHTPTFDYLIATELEIQVPGGWQPAAVDYPPGQKKSFAFADVPLSVYDGDVVIQAKVTVPSGTKPGVFPLRARLHYQACDHSQCLPPVTSESQLTLTVGAAAHGAATSTGAAGAGAPAPVAPTAGTAVTPETAAAAAANGAPEPRPLPGHTPMNLGDTAAGKPPEASADSAGGASTGVPAVRGTASSAPSSAAASASPSTGASASSSTGAGASPSVGATASPSTAAGASPSVGATASPSTAAGASPSAAGAGTAAPAPRPAAPAARAGARPGSLAAMLLIAVLGGLILNAMPCVLPVVSLKVFGLVRSAAQGRREVVRSALAIAAGILVSFAALAALAVAAAAAGAAVGWGVQFQRPGFVAFLTVVVILFCLNLWGLFEIPLPRALAHLGGTATREGLAGHFASGLFATLMATPCSAPFLGTAIGFALAQPAPIVFAIFLAAGTGLALPYLVLAAAPGAARFLPRPGAWMETVRGIMGFLLAASAVWLLYVLSAQVSPERLATFEVGLLLIGLFTWLRHRTVAGSTLAHRAAGAALAVFTVGAVTLAAAAPGADSSGAGGGLEGAGSRLAAQGKPSGLIGWVAFDRAKAESLAAAGQLVFVDVTADWCFTCKVNERLVLDTPEIAAAFATHHVLPMRADWTNRNDAITHFLADNGRYGIPFYLLYRPGREPLVFSELPSKTAILTALDAAADTADRAARK